jgi:ABC-type amino acid transport system permease subunit
MTTPTKPNPIPQAAALILVSLGVAFMMLHSDASSLAKLDSMSATDFVQKEREAHQHSFIFHFIVFMFVGAIYIKLIEFFTYVVGLCFKKPAA